MQCKTWILKAYILVKRNTQNNQPMCTLHNCTAEWLPLGSAKKLDISYCPLLTSYTVNTEWTLHSNEMVLQGLTQAQSNFIQKRRQWPFWTITWRISPSVITYWELLQKLCTRCSLTLCQRKVRLKQSTESLNVA